MFRLMPRTYLQGVGESDFSAALRASLEEEEDPEEIEKKLVMSLLGDIEGGDQIQGLAGVKKFIGDLLQIQGKFKDMEKGHTQATQRLGDIEKKLFGIGIHDVDAWLGGGTQKKQGRKDKLNALMEKYQLDPKARPFWDDLSEIITGNDGVFDEMQTALMVSWALINKLADSHWQGQLRSDPNYKGLDDETMGKLMERFGKDRDGALRTFIEDGKNPLQRVYTQLFAELHPEVLQKKIEEKAEMKADEKGQQFVERPGEGGAPVHEPKEKGGARSPEQIAKEIEKVSGGEIKINPASED